MIYPIIFLLAMALMVSFILVCENRARKRRVTRCRTAFAEAYNAWKRAVNDPYTGEIPSLYREAERTGRILAYQKGNA